METPTLSLCQQLCLLSVRPEKGRLYQASTNIQYGLVGAALMDLSLAGRIDFDDKLLIVKDSSAFNEEHLDFVLSRINGSERNYRLRRWIRGQKINNAFFRNEVINSLVDRNYIRISQHRFLGFIPFRKLYIVDRRHYNKLSDSLKKMLRYTRTDDERMNALLILVFLSRIHYRVFRDRPTRKMAVSLAKKLIKDDRIGSVLQKTIREMNAVIASSGAAAASAGAH